MDKVLLSNIQKWHDDDKHEKIISEILKIPKTRRDYEFTGLLARAYNNSDDYDKAIEQLLSVSEQGENDSIWVFRLAYAYFYKNENEKALELFERCKALNPDEQDVDYFINLVRQYLSNSSNSVENGSGTAYAPYWELRLEKVKLPESKNDFFENDISPAFFLDISNTNKGLCYECALTPFEDESDGMKQLNDLLAKNGYEVNGYGWESYLCGFISQHNLALFERLETDSESGTCGIYVFDRDDFYVLLEVISKAIRNLYIVTPPKERPEIEYLADMYNDDYYPEFLVNKVKTELLAVVDFIMSGVHTYEEIQLKFDDCVISINALEGEFDENGSEIETVARDSIGTTVMMILERFGIEIDVETAIRERDW